MKIKHKIGIGLLLLLLPVLSWLMSPAKALAASKPATAADAQQCIKTLKFINFAQITCQTTQGTVTFTDSDPTDGKVNFSYANDTSGIFCNTIPLQPVFDGYKYMAGISKNGGHFSLSDAGQPLGVTANLGITTNGTDCVRYGDKNHGIDITISDTSNMVYLYQVSGNTILPLNGVDQGALSGSGWTEVDGYDPSNGKVLAFYSGDYKNCSGSVLIVSPSGKNSVGKLYNLNRNSGGFDKTKYPDLYQFLQAQGVSGCGVSGDSNGIPPAFVGFSILGQATANAQPTPGGSTGSTCTSGAGCSSSGVCTNATAGCLGGDQNTCEDRSVGFPIRWLLCPLLDGANAAGEKLRLEFEQQLSFTLHDPSNPTHPSTTTSAVKDTGLTKIKTAWSVIRIIASSMMIIIMLVMVLSEAIGGPFDAYTVRKVLPRLVIAVILIQISWSIFIWMVDAVDDLGRGLADIMYQPFGGSKSMDLWTLMSNAGISTTTAGVASWVGLIGVIIAGAVALPSVLMFCIVAVFAIVTGLLVLLFRKILIILGLIFAPLALLTWILPGTQKYWKLWYDNLLKALLMFPIVVAIIAAGRIFASVASTQGNGTLINFFIVLVGFFGPLFILPKTFQWGGQLMSATGNLASKMTSPLGKKTGEFAKGWTNRNVTGKFAKKYAPKEAPGSTFGKRALYSVLGGRIIPSKYQRAVMTQRGDEWSKEQDALAEAVVSRSFEVAQKSEKGLDTLEWDAEHDNGDGTFGAVVTNNKKGVGAAKAELVKLMQSKDERVAKLALQRFLKTASWPELQSLRLDEKGTRISDLPIWNKEITNNPELYPMVNQSRVDMAPHVNGPALSASEMAAITPDELHARSAARLDKALAGYIGTDNIASQAQGFFQDIGEVAATAHTDEQRTTAAKLSDSLGQKLAAIAAGGTGTMATLGRLHDNASLTKDVDRALSGRKFVMADGSKVTLGIEDFIEHARQGGGPKSLQQLAEWKHAGRPTP